ncbi:hypothetical protein [Albidovulum sediminis]|uniref:Uncharacterized protein n=1 Tax=Albidovulum sediminis TaxID=3066345 RepID=A0ABT2NPG4_9RHOB|nr:hypothetical protein [Defluviimonas sediminis]MCT8329849.1 hypothetical protein [Defluviimonas sediminis]
MLTTKHRSPALVAPFIFVMTTAVSAAQDFVAANGQLRDDDFYRLVACGAPPGGNCKTPFVRWSRRAALDVSVGIAGVDEGYPPGLRARIEATLDPTLQTLNELGAKLRFTRASPDTKPDIRIFLLDLPRSSNVRGTGLSWLDGHPLQAARFQLRTRGDGTVIECAIALSRDVKSGMVERLLFEEIVQCSGLMTDVSGSYYENRSIFSETGAVNAPGIQDIMALRRHYP